MSQGQIFFFEEKNWRGEGGRLEKVVIVESRGGEVGEERGNVHLEASNDKK